MNEALEVISREIEQASDPEREEYVAEGGEVLRRQQRMDEIDHLIRKEQEKLALLAGELDALRAKRASLMVSAVALTDP